MTTWTQYPHAEGHYKEDRTLVLTAWPNGSWSVYDKLGRSEPRSSVFAPILHPENGIEEAKKLAEEAAKLMSNG